MEQAQEHAQSASRLASALGEWVVHVPLCRTCTTEIPNRQPAPLVARRTTRHRLTFYPIIRKYWLIANSHWWSFSAPWRLTTYIYRFSTVPLIDVYMRKHITIGIRVTARQGEFSPKEYEKERLTRANISGMTSLLHLWGTIRGEILGTMGSRRGRNRRNCVLNRRQPGGDPWWNCLLKAKYRGEPQGMFMKGFLTIWPKLLVLFYFPSQRQSLFPCQRPLVTRFLHIYTVHKSCMNESSAHKH
jgi:hypothetical protein